MLSPKIFTHELELDTAEVPLEVAPGGDTYSNQGQRPGAPPVNGLPISNSISGLFCGCKSII